MTPTDVVDAMDDLRAQRDAYAEAYSVLWHRHRAMMRRLRWETEAVQDRPLPSPDELAHRGCG